MKPNYNKTIYACFIGYIVQAIINNFVPLLFLTFQSSYGISISKITMLVTFNFGVQLVIDLISIGFIDKIGYRASIIIAHLFAALGLASLAFLPDLTPDPFIGLLISVTIYAIGGGLLEVLVSPIVESCPNDRKEQTMSLLHSFYCWGHVGVVMLSTAFFAIAGIHRWKILSIIWALIPLCNTFLFAKVPMVSLIEEGEKGFTVLELFKKKVFWILILLMVCAGASEQAVSQWASTLAEKGLGVSKTIGDLAGPMFFAIMMGLSRLIYGKYGDRINLEKFMISSGVLCFISYLVISLTKHPLLGFIGCGLCGLSVGIMWPGTFSMAAASLKKGGTSMFALLALAGDLGCSGGPTFVGMVSTAFQDNLKKGILFAIIFPILLIVGILMNQKLVKAENG
ncbi:MAG TPA: MFS transporter [Candidatus Merdenecus merdavium]|nr:MFS transporter [Candidatus Merdenecus merdavium]